MIVCPKCKSPDSKVVNSRPNKPVGVKRKRVCDKCQNGYWTLETIFTPQTPKKKAKPPPRPLKRRLTPRNKPVRPKPEPVLPDFQNMTDDEIEEYFYADE